jgi:hypothetical protein
MPLPKFNFRNPFRRNPPAAQPPVEQPRAAQQGEKIPMPDFWDHRPGFGADIYEEEQPRKVGGLAAVWNKAKQKGAHLRANIIRKVEDFKNNRYGRDIDTLERAEEAEGKPGLKPAWQRFRGRMVGNRVNRYEEERNRRQEQWHNSDRWSGF